jgi:hypothetical protein
MSVNDLLEEALQLPPAERAGLVEKIVESLAVDIDPSIEAAHLETIARRREQGAETVPGDEVLSRAQAILQK